MIRPSLKKLLLGTTLLALSGSALCLVAPATAQQADQQTPDVVVVTGTRIVREGYVSASPVMTVSPDELEKRQPVDVESVLRQLPQFQPGNGGQVNNGSSGASTVDLRGLTTPRTLPLIDGKRMVGFDPNGLFDVSAIPLALLKRVDVVTGGASAVYGSDAVAGVVNFILDDDFRGFQADANYSITDHGDGETDSLQLTTGVSLDGGRGSAVLSVGYLNKEPVYQVRGPATATPGASLSATPATLRTAGGDMQFAANGNLVTPYSAFDFNPQNLYQTPQERWNALALAKYAINDHVEAYARFIYNQSHSAPQLASSPVGLTFEVPVNNPFLNTQARDYLLSHAPSAPAACSDPAAGQCVKVGIRWRAVDVGPRQYQFNYDTFQSLVGLRGDFDLLGSNWKWDVDGAHGETTLARTQANDVNSLLIQQALFATNATTCTNTANGCAPLNLFNPSAGINPAALQFIRLNLQLQSKTKQDYVTGSISGDLGNIKSPLATSPIGVSFGMEYRGESSNYQPDSASQSGISPGFGATLPISGRYDVTEEFVEALVPVVEEKPFIKSINVELGFRNSNYSTSGVTHSYKYGADWSPFDGLRFRGMFQRAVRAANVAELYSPNTPGTGDLLVDQCANGTATAPLTGALRALCLATGVPASALNNGSLAQPNSGQVNNFAGGNTTLKPEEADTKTFGFVWQPDFVHGLGITVDYYDIKIADAIALRPLSDIMDGCYSSARNTSLSASAADCSLIKRDPLTGALDSDPIYGVTQLNSNIGEVHAEGVDYGIHYAFDLPGSFGGLDIGLDGTHVLDSSYVPVPGGATVSCEGHYGKDCGLPSTVTASTGGPTPKDHFVQSIAWTFRPFGSDMGVSYQWRHLSGVTVDEGQAAVVTAPSNRIPAYDYLDLAAFWQITDWARLKFAVSNVTDQEAPIVVTGTGSTTFNSGNTYPSTYDVLGRVFSVGLTTKF